jgi:hypothetical protein
MQSGGSQLFSRSSLANEKHGSIDRRNAGESFLKLKEYL